ncbi:S1 family peptidase [Consotaella salsifontis]|uniref:Trypsin-like peptidase domain-containing protein n=1 Tax=Consotaella salsifontis TaxID=1365950 RepID=A0A1T4LK55_9HYPH|nr:serine protease [Consotaella salsifontis]SJZ55133.1 Trypsin-like peptidase domain-containing protein [Consotaella salsifontis]
MAVGPDRAVSRRGGGWTAAAFAAALASTAEVGTTEASGTVAPLSSVVRTADRSVIPEGMSALGTGFFIAPDRILTSAHVLAGCGVFVVASPIMGVMPAAVVRREVTRDSAVLSVDRSSPFFLARAPTTPRRQGQSLRVFGFPEKGSAGSPPVSYPAWYESDLADRNGIPVIAVRAAIPPGVSGAPVLDSTDAVVGVIVGRLDSDPQNVIALSTEGLSPKTVKDFASAPAAQQPKANRATFLRSGEPQNAVVQIRCR